MQYFQGMEGLKLNLEKINHILYIYEFMLFYIIYVHFLTVSPGSLPWYLHQAGKVAPLSEIHVTLDLFILSPSFTLGFLRAELV